MNIVARRFLAFSCGLVAACGGGGGGGGGDGGGGGGGPGIQAPSNFIYPTTTAIYLNEVAVPPNIPTYTGMVDTFSVSPPLPAGLIVHPLVGAVVGIPTEAHARTVHTVTASNAGGSAQFALTITVVAPPRFVYVLCDDGTIAVFNDDPITGHLRRKGYIAPGANQVGPEKLVIHPNNRFVYVTNLATSNVSVYTIAPVSGWLTAGTAVDAGSGQHSLAIDPAGKWAYVSSRVSDSIHAYTISATSGALTLVGTPVNAGTQPSALAVDPTGKFLFATLHGDPTTGAGSALAVFDINATTGAITPHGTPFDLASSKPVAIALDPVKTVLYVTEASTNNVAALRFDAATGAITSIGVDATGIQPAGVSGHPSGKLVYVANSDPTAMAGSVSIFTVDATSGDLTPAGSAASGKVPLGVTVDPTGKFAYVAGHDSNDLTQYKINASTGALTLEDNFVTRAGPVDVAIVAAPHLQTIAPRYAYTTNAGSNDVSAFSIDASNGGLIEILPTVNSGTTPISLALDPQQRYLYVANQLSSNVAVFSPSSSTGALIQTAPVAPVFGHPTHIAVDPSGRFVYIVCRGQANPDVGLLLTYSIDTAAGGALTPANVVFIDPRPTWVQTDPTGQFLYAACSGLDDGTGANINRFMLPVATGIPANVMPSSSTPTVGSLGFHPKGKYLYATLKGTQNKTLQFAIDSVTGALSSVGTAVSDGIEPSGIDITSDGRFAYIVYTNSAGPGLGHVAFYQVDSMNGNLKTPPDFAQDGPHPTALAIDPASRFLYVSNAGSNDVSVMGINPETGVLTIGTPTMSGLSPTSIVVMGVPQ